MANTSTSAKAAEASKTETPAEAAQGNGGGAASDWKASATTPVPTKGPVVGTEDLRTAEIDPSRTRSPVVDDSLFDKNEDEDEAVQAQPVFAMSDEYGNNDNNRRVAERMAKDGEIANPRMNHPIFNSPTLTKKAVEDAAKNDKGLQRQLSGSGWSRQG